MRPSRLAWAAAALMVAGALAVFVASRAAARKSPAPVLPSLWKAPAFSYLDQDRRAFSDRDLLGKVWISDFFFTSCTSICPTMTASMSRLANAIPGAGVHFVSFSVDPEHDSPERLKEYAALWKADLSRWHFLSTEKEKLAATAAGMKTFVQPPDKDNPIQHSVLFSLADRDGMVRGVYDGSDPVALRRLTLDALTLAGAPPSAAPDLSALWPAPQSRGGADSRGARLYASRGCLACHAQGRVAPPLEGLLGARVALADGRTVIADRDYLRESILDAGAKVAAGYPNLMPSYRGQLRDDEIEDLVAYIESLEGNDGRGGMGRQAGTEAGRETLDPVCKMKVAAGQNTPQARYRGRTYWFCSETCRETFSKDPSRFAGPWDRGDHP